MSVRTLSLTDPLYEYLLQVSLREPPVLAELREHTASHPMVMMQIAPEQGQFMALLARLTGTERYLEVGVFTGYSSLAVALALPADGRIVACDINPEWTAIAEAFWRRGGVRDRIDLRLGPALETLDGLLAAGEARTYDFAFIDADKENYGAYYERVLELLRPGGLVAVDNTLWGGSVIDPDKRDADTRAIRHFNTSVLADQRVDLSLVPIGDGLTLARKR